MAAVPSAGGRAAAKRNRSELSSDSSVDGDLSYLNLDSGRVVTHPKTPNEAEGILMTSLQFDSIMTKFQTLEKGLSKLNKLDKLDHIETTLKTLDTRIIDIEKRLTNSETNIKNVEASVQFVSDKFDEIVTERKEDAIKTKTIEKSYLDIKRENDEMRKAVASLNETNACLKNELVDIKSRSMRDNLVFTNIEYRQGEDCVAVLCSFIREKLKITDTIQFERVHRSNPSTHRPRRLDNNGRPAPRPIIAKFSFFKDRETVRKSGRMLKGTCYGIHEQFPEEVEATRRKLYPILRQARRDNKKAVLVKDRLYVDGAEVRADAQSVSGLSPGQGRRTSPQRPAPQSTSGAEGSNF